MFLEQFSKYFTQEQRESEMYNIFAQIGVNMEKAIKEELTAKVYEMSDINNFSEDVMRSWLAFFLQKVSYRISAEVTVLVDLQNDVSGNIDIPRKSKLVSDSGMIWTQLNDLQFIEKNKKVPINLVQGQFVEEEGVYSGLIKISAQNPDMRYITVSYKRNGQWVEVPEVSYQTSYDLLKYMGSCNDVSVDNLSDINANRGEYYIVTTSGVRDSEIGVVRYEVGDIICYDGSHWVKSFKSNNIKPLQFDTTYAIPSDGFFAYYYDGYLYIKIFKGARVGDINGLQYKVEYLKSDGVQGSLNENESLQYINTYKDKDDNVAKLVIDTNGQLGTKGINQPTVGKLGLYLKQRLYSGINISSVPEYTHWFKAQDEIGDAIVYSDFERFKIAQANGSQDAYYATGIVEVVALDQNAEPFTDGGQTFEKLLDRLEPYKDIAVLTYTQPIKSLQVIDVEYKLLNQSQITDYESYIRNKIDSYYNLDYLHSKGESLFGDIDLSKMLDDLLDTDFYNAQGLTLTGYHYALYDNVSSQMTFTSLGGEGYNGYVVVTSTKDGVKNEIVLREIWVNGNISSYVIAKPHKVDENHNDIVVGTHINDIITIHNLKNIPQLQDLIGENYNLEVYTSMKNEGILTVGALTAYRKLHQVNIVKVD